MQPTQSFNFLILGRSGAGKSATSKLLTGDPSILVSNSTQQVTKEIHFYQAIIHQLESEQIKFGVLDVPGLDKVENRFEVRQKILSFLQKYNIVLHGIIYVASLTERDTIEKNKIFQFIDQLPWSSEAKRSSLIPILTKYDNLVIDSPEEDIRKTKEEFAEMFNQQGYETAWGKRVYWINFTKSLQFKIKYSEQIREKFENQIQRFLQMVKKNKRLLTAESLQHHIRGEDHFVSEALLKKLSKQQISFVPKRSSHRLSLSIKIEPAKIFESVTAMSASSIGLILSKAIKNDISLPFSLILMGIPLSITIANLLKRNSFVSDKKVSEESFNYKIMKNYNEICKMLNKELDEEWSQLNKKIQFYLQKTELVCRVSKNIKGTFFLLDELKLKEIFQEKQFEKDEKNETQNHYFFKIPIPHFNEETVWEPVIEVEYGIKVFEEETLMKAIENLRLQFSKK